MQREVSTNQAYVIVNLSSDGFTGSMDQIVRRTSARPARPGYFESIDPRIAVYLGLREELRDYLFTSEPVRGQGGLLQILRQGRNDLINTNFLAAAVNSLIVENANRRNPDLTNIVYLLPPHTTIDPQGRGCEFINLLCRSLETLNMAARNIVVVPPDSLSDNRGAIDFIGDNMNFLRNGDLVLTRVPPAEDEFLRNPRLWWRDLLAGINNPHSRQDMVVIGQPGERVLNLEETDEDRLSLLDLVRSANRINDNASAANLRRPGQYQVRTWRGLQNLPDYSYYTAVGVDISDFFKNLAAGLVEEFVELRGNLRFYNRDILIRELVHKTKNALDVQQAAYWITRILGSDSTTEDLDRINQAAAGLNVRYYSSVIPGLYLEVSGGRDTMIKLIDRRVVDENYAEQVMRSSV